MHLANGAVTPECIVLSYGAAAAGLAASVRALRKSRPSTDQLLLAAAVGTAILAAQSINVPISSTASAHLLGGALAAWLLGPALGAWTMALVLLVQSCALADGGLAALGANICNMALLPAGAIALTRHVARSQRSLSPAAVGLAAGVSVLLAALLIVAETAAFRPAAELAGWTDFALTMLTTHAWIGVLEGGLTVALVVALTPLLAAAPARRLHRLALVGLAAAMLLAALTLPIASSLPDGYEAAAAASGLGHLLAP